MDIVLAQRYLWLSKYQSKKRWKQKLGKEYNSIELQKQNHENSSLIPAWLSLWHTNKIQVCADPNRKPCAKYIINLSYYSREKNLSWRYLHIITWVIDSFWKFFKKNISFLNTYLAFNSIFVMLFNSSCNKNLWQYFENYRYISPTLPYKKISRTIYSQWA